MATQPILLAGKWQQSNSVETFRAEDPAQCAPSADTYPISTWRECEAALDAARRAHEELSTMPSERIAQFLDAYAGLIEEQADSLCAMAHTETALAIKPRLRDVELPRTTSQLRQA